MRGEGCAAPAEAPSFEIPVAVRPYVEAIGADAAAEVFLAFGGAKLYLAADPKSRSPLAEKIGREKAIALGRALGPGHVQVPTGKDFLARLWRSQGWKIAEIARRLHTKDSTVRRYVNGKPAAELPLFPSLPR